VLVDAFTVQDADLQPKSIVASGDGLFFAQNNRHEGFLRNEKERSDLSAESPDTSPN
jgi:hypothetical protein